MRDFTKSEILAVLIIVKSPEMLYNANSLSKVLGITSMGTLKILKRLEKEGVLKSMRVGKSGIYRINVDNEYARKYVTFLLASEAVNAGSVTKMWINEIRKLKNADVAVLFGSVLRKENPNDIDVLFVTDQERFERLKEEVAERNRINIKPIHAVYQSSGDLVANIRKRDKVILKAIKGIVVIGEEKFIGVYNESRKE